MKALSQNEGRWWRWWAGNGAVGGATRVRFMVGNPAVFTADGYAICMTISDTIDITLGAPTGAAPKKRVSVVTAFRLRLS